MHSGPLRLPLAMIPMTIMLMKMLITPVSLVAAHGQAVVVKIAALLEFRTVQQNNRSETIA